jgi:hypothetical protein
VGDCRRKKGVRAEGMHHGNEPRLIKKSLSMAAVD